MYLMEATCTEITPSTTIAEVLECSPRTAAVFFRHRMACVGCCLRAFDTVAEAARNYGLPPAQFAAELRRAAAPQPEVPQVGN